MSICLIYHYLTNMNNRKYVSVCYQKRIELLKSTQGNYRFYPPSGLLMIQRLQAWIYVQMLHVSPGETSKNIL